MGWVWSNSSKSMFYSEEMNFAKSDKELELQAQVAEERLAQHQLTEELKLTTIRQEKIQQNYLEKIEELKVVLAARDGEIDEQKEQIDSYKLLVSSLEKRIYKISEELLKNEQEQMQEQISEMGTEEECKLAGVRVDIATENEKEEH